MKNQIIDNDGKHLVSIINTHTCKTHAADIGEPCYAIPSDRGGKLLRGVCNKRAVLAGANGKITESSYQLKRKRHG